MFFLIYNSVEKEKRQEKQEKQKRQTKQKRQKKQKRQCANLTNGLMRLIKPVLAGLVFEILNSYP